MPSPTHRDQHGEGDQAGGGMSALEHLVHGSTVAGWLLVLAGAVVGAPLRFLVDLAVQRRHDTVFPWGTFTVNVVACLVLGGVTGAVVAGAASHSWQLLLGTGLCGTLSTYSTFSYETLRLAETRARFFAAANVGASVLAGAGAFVVGDVLVHAVWT